MANISTAGAMSGKDFVTKEGPVETEDFNFLFNYCIDNLRKLNQINDETSFKIELNKIRKRMKKIIKEHFEPSLSTISTNQLYEEKAKELKEKLNTIYNKIQ